MSSETLSQEQRERIERNREKALALRNQKQQQQQLTPEKTVNSTSIAQRFTGILNPSPSRTSNEAATNFKTPSTSTSTSATTSFLSNGQQESPSKTSKYWIKSGYVDDNKLAALASKPAKKPVVNCVLTTNYRFEVYCLYHKEAIDIFRSTQGAEYCPSTKRWSFPLSSYRELEKKLKALTTITFDALPQHITNVFAKYISGTLSTSPDKAEFDLRNVDENLLSRLFPFQRECINFAISKGGRVLVADDMGLGKTVEALGIMDYYRDDWPALIVCPASLRYTWKHAVLDWLPSVKDDQIAVIDSNNDFDSILCKSMRITIIGYSSDLLTKEAKLSQIDRKFKVGVLDESHFIKNPETKRTMACERILKNAKRVILLTGTPALSRPKELFTQIKIIDPKLFRSFNQFGARYCNPQQKRIGKNRTIMDYGGAANMEELEVLLRETVMIRRVKEDVLHQLPAKIRGIVMLDSKLVKIDEVVAVKARKNLQDTKLTGSEKHGAMLEYYSATATSKLRAVTEYVLELLEKGKKFLLFAHHRVLLDHLHSNIAQTSHDVIRIDGSTPAFERNRLCEKFQTDPTVRVALLSITATGVGLTLTAANLVVFAELFWNPGVLAQAEDRAHRVGQCDSVHVQYLVAQGTADDFIWPLIQKKLDILNKGGLSKGAFKMAETTCMESTSKEVKPAQTSITDFMETLCDEDLLALDPFNQDTEPNPPKKQKIDYSEDKDK